MNIIIKDAYFQHIIINLHHSLHLLPRERSLLSQALLTTDKRQEMLAPHTAPNQLHPHDKTLWFCLMQVHQSDGIDLLDSPFASCLVLIHMEQFMCATLQLLSMASRMHLYRKSCAPRLISATKIVACIAIFVCILCSVFVCVCV